MKYISNNEADGVLERLLGAEIGRASRNGLPCAQFDPDLSTAYIERNLTPGEIARYEVHLAACPKCRIQVASLARLGYADTSIEPAREIAPSSQVTGRVRNRRVGLSRAFEYLLQPQWIAVGTAALVLLLALPVFIILKTSKRSSPNAVSLSAGNVEPAPLEMAKRESDRDLQSSGLVDGQVRQAGNKDSSEEDQRTPAANPLSPASPQPGDTATGMVRTEATVAVVTANSSEPAPPKTEAGVAGKLSDNTKLAQNNPQPGRLQDNEQQRNQSNSKVEETAPNGQIQDKLQSPAPPSQVVADQNVTVAKKADQPATSEQISPKEAQTLPEDDKQAGVVTIVKPGGAGPEGARARESHVTIRPKDSEPPTKESRRDETERRIAKKGPSRGSAASGGIADVDSARKPATPPLIKGQKLERRVDTKRFRMQAGIWTDRDFKPAKEIPAVTLIRDTELFRSALEKQPALKSFLAEFSSDERVIIVYKGIVYKIEPSKN